MANYLHSCPPQDIVDQAFALMPGGSFAQKLLGDYAQTSESRMAQAVQRSRFEWLEEDVGEIKEQVSKLMETVEERDWLTPEDVAAVLQASVAHPLMDLLTYLSQDRK